MRHPYARPVADDPKPQHDFFEWRWNPGVILIVATVLYFAIQFARGVLAGGFAPIAH